MPTSTTNVQRIVSALVLKLQGVSGLAEVFAYEPDAPTNGNYPFATITPQSFTAEFADTQRNLRTYTFAIRLYQERTATAFGNQKAERLIREMVDEITTAFDMDTTLSGMVHWVKPIRGDLSYIDREIGDTRIAEFTIEAKTIVDSL